MQTIPRDATPTWAKPKYPVVPKDAAPRFDAPPIPIILPDFPFIPPSSDTALNLIWNNQYENRPANETTVYYGTNELWTAVIVGTWPLGTDFSWVVIESSFLTRKEVENSITFVIDSTGIIVVSAQVKPPNSELQIIGPITLTVTNSGCC